MTKSIKSLLTNIIPQEHAWKIALFERWSSTVGPLSKYVSIDKIEGSTLFIGVSHPTWAQELQALTPMILEKLNADHPGHLITAIKLRPITRSKKPIVNRKPIVAEARTNVELSASETQLLASMENNQLQSSMAAYLLRCKARKLGSKLL